MQRDDFAAGLFHLVDLRLYLVTFGLKLGIVHVIKGTAIRENGGDKLVHGSGGISQPRAE